MHAQRLRSNRPDCGIVRRAMLAALASSLLLFAAPSLAWADTASEQALWQQALDATVAGATSPYAYASNHQATTAELPETFDLRNATITTQDGRQVSGNFVTPVKFQNPWGTCWGFSAIAASETSILTDLGITADSALGSQLDLSELHLAYYAFTAAQTGQAGEGGALYIEGTINAGLSFGGLPLYATALFSSGTGPVYEWRMPYKNAEDAVAARVFRKQDDGSLKSAIEAVYLKLDVYGNGAVYDYYDRSQPIGYFNGQDGTVYADASYNLPISESNPSGDIVMLVPLYYASLIPEEGKTITDLNNDDDSNGEGGVKSTEATWATDAVEAAEAEGDDLWSHTDFELEESFIFPELCKTHTNESGETVYDGIDESVLQAMKEQLVAGRALSVVFHADTSMPGQEASTDYINSKWAHYTNEVVSANHAVTIVGYDDTYAKENFATDFVDDPEAHTPPADGAFIVKNSWGSEEAVFPNSHAWGIENEDGEHTGYFYISYYDQTIAQIETFDFDVSDYADESEFIIDQYNYLAGSTALETATDERTSMANVFTAEEARTVRTLTCETTHPNTTVTYELYLLDSDASTPTQGQLAASVTETYELGGYHRVTLPESEWVAMRAGQRYSVVVTQQGEDGKYYRSVAQGVANFTEDEATWNAMVEGSIAALVMQEGQDAYDEAISEGKTEEEAKRAQAEAIAERQAYYKTDEGRAEAEGFAYSINGGMGVLYFTAVVNPGESYTLSYDATGAASWVDWSDVVGTLSKVYTYDNFPIKAIADYAFDDKGDYASAQTLSGLKAAVDSAEASLHSLVVSADGTDVPVGQKWVTKAAYDELRTAVDAARELLAGAGDDFSLATLTTPSEAGASAALASLQNAASAFEESAQAGTKASAGTKVTDERRGGDADADGGSNGAPGTRGASRLPGTGDEAAWQLMAAVSCAALSVLALWFGFRRAKSSHVKP